MLANCIPACDSAERSSAVNSDIHTDQVYAMKILRNLFRKKSESLSDNASFVTLVRVAKEDPKIREQLVSILALDDFNRRSALNTLIEQLRYKQAPPSFISAMAMLIDDDIARKVLDVIGEDTP